MYAVNYKNNGGYLIVQTDQNKFPIVSFNNKGNFYFNELGSAQKISFQKEYTNYIESNGQQLNVWSDILDCLNNPELNDDGIPVNSKDSVCVTTIEFQPVDSLTEEDLSATDEIVIYEDIPHSLEATRAIPERKKPLNRPGIYPMVGIWNLQWHSGNPYNLEMPTDGNKPIDVPHVSVALGKIMYHHWCPGRFAWMYLPRQVAQNQKSLVSSILKDISDNIGCVKTHYFDYDLPCKQIPLIPSILETKFDYAHGGNIIQYKNDEATFFKVYNSLMNYCPVLFSSMSQNHSLKSPQYIRSAWIVDGYQEVRVKVVKRWYFLGFWNYKTRTYYYYRDYFHYICSSYDYWKEKGDCYNSSYDGWYRYDYKTSNRFIKNYAIVNISSY